MMTVQYRLGIGRKDEVVEGPDDADVVVTVPLTAVSDGGFDPTVAYMQGVLKATGSTGALLQLLASGEAGDALSRLASPV